MLDDLHDLADSSNFLDDLVEEDASGPPRSQKGGGSGGGRPRRRRPSSSSKQFLGMTSFQRFIISGMLFGMVLVGGFVVLVLLGFMTPSF